MRPFRVLLIPFFLIMVISCQHKKESLDCKGFRTGGDFYIMRKPENKKYLIKRRGLSQTEYDESADSTTRYKVEWTGDCEYELRRISKVGRQSGDTSLPQQLLADSRMIPLKVRITEITKEYYVFESAKEGIDFTYKDTLWIIRLIGGFKSMSNTFK